ncbi:MAG: hypothetical protein AABX30_02165 [Nanoarchaeota archaeon]
MKKTGKIFIGLIIIELIVFLSLYFVFIDRCASQCSVYRFINPLGIGSPKTCIQTCITAPNQYSYLAGDVLILTIFIYLIYLLIKSLTRAERRKK